MQNREMMNRCVLCHHAFEESFDDAPRATASVFDHSILRLGLLSRLCIVAEAMGGNSNVLTEMMESD
jgi:hypothetical protein